MKFIHSVNHSFNHFRVTYYCQCDDNCNLKYQHRRFRKSDLHWKESPSHKETYLLEKSYFKDHVGVNHCHSCQPHFIIS